MFGSIGPTELILIFVIALLVFGPKKLPDIGKSVGKALGEFKRASEEIKGRIEEEIQASEIKDIHKELKDGVESLRDGITGLKNDAGEATGVSAPSSPAPETKEEPPADSGDAPGPPAAPEGGEAKKEDLIKEAVYDETREGPKISG